MTFAVLIKTNTNAIAPYSCGVSKRASMIVTINDTTCTLHRSKNFQNNDCSIVCFVAGIVIYEVIYMQTLIRSKEEYFLISV